MSKNDPAFPCANHSMPDEKGITIRDYFAAKAMQAAFTHALRQDPQDSPETIALAAYFVADAMLAERDKES
jgi:hypothetical protein